MMYITKIRLKDVRCFDEVEIDLSDCKLGTSILIAGNNGIGKSAILRAIAMGLCDRDSAASLLRELEGNFIRNRAKGQKGTKGERQADIAISLVGEQKKEWEIKTTVVEWKELIIERVRQTYNGDDAEDAFVKFSNFWSQLFVAGYGAGLRTTATAKFTDYFAPDALYSLFKYDTPLQDPELAWRRLRSAEDQSRSYKNNPNQLNGASSADEMVRGILRHVLDLSDDADVVLEPDGIYITEHKVKKALDAMGDGHKALLKVTLDILVWYLLKLNYSDHKGEERDWNALPVDSDKRPDIGGIVIIDEIEQHLHPKLQRQILKRLHEKFPKIQFIITTHSPLCISGTADVEVEGEPGYQIYSIYRTDAGEVGIEKKPIPHGLTSDQILVDYFELPTTINVSLENDYIRARDLLLKERTPVEEIEFQALQKKLSERAPVLGESLHERELMASLKRNTDEIAKYLRVQENHDKAQ
jgi:hypothetical protein